MPKKDNKNITKEKKEKKKIKRSKKVIEYVPLSEYDSDSYFLSKKVNKFVEGTEGDDYVEEKVEDEVEEEVMSDNVEIEDEDDNENETKSDNEGDELPDNEPDNNEPDNNVNDACIHKYVADKDDESDDDLGEVYNETQIYVSKAIVSNENRKTKPFLTKYERIRLISTRAKQLSLGAKPMSKNVDNISAKEVALKELEDKVIPFKIERPLPDGKIERWNIDEFVNL